MNPIWKPKHETYGATIEYIKGRKDGTIKSLLTPWERINVAGVDGIEWGTAVLMAARSGVGKSLWKDQLVNQSFKLNPSQRFRVLQYEYEMPTIMSNVRELGAYLKKTYQYVCSATDDANSQMLSDKEIQDCINYFTNKVSKIGDVWDSRIDVIEQHLKVSQFKQSVLDYAHKYPEDDILVTVDHIRLTEWDGDNENNMLRELSKTIIELKRYIRPNNKRISFVLLNHLNRNILDQSRCDEGKYANYVTDNDVYGSDSVFQAVEMVIGMDCPAQRQIRYYGPSRYMIENDRVLVNHLLKVRNGPKGMIFNYADYENMQIKEIETPVKVATRTQTK